MRSKRSSRQKQKQKLNHLLISHSPGREYATGNFQAALFAVRITSSSSHIALPLHQTEVQITCTPHIRRRRLISNQPTPFVLSSDEFYGLFLFCIHFFQKHIFLFLKQFKCLRNQNNRTFKYRNSIADDCY